MLNALNRPFRLCPAQRKIGMQHKCKLHADVLERNLSEKLDNLNGILTTDSKQECSLCGSLKILRIEENMRKSHVGLVILKKDQVTIIPL